MIYLVTGAAGFIGAKVCELLLASGHTVVGVDNLNDYYDVRLKDFRLGRLLGHEAGGFKLAGQISAYAGRGQQVGGTGGAFIFEPIDIEQLPTLERLFSEFNFDAVFNLAARAGVRYSMENPHVYLSTNTQGTLNVLECMRRHGVRKHVLASTSSLYAGCAMPFTEDLPVNNPLSPYAVTKKAAELMAYSYGKLYGLDTTVVRYFTVFGPAGRPDMSYFRFIQQIDQGKPIVVYGDGSQSRDFTYVDDIARGTILAAKPLGYEIINLGGGRNPISLQHMIETIEVMIGRKAVIQGKPFHAADLMETWADIGKAQRVLGWEPRTTFHDGLRETVAWHQANKEWLCGISCEDKKA
jgi:nucleoside-diphosphate-sugar epimerase